MAKTTAATPAVTADQTREELLNMLMNGTQSKGYGLITLASNLAARSMDTAAVIGGALTGAWGNAKQRFQMEANFRAAERQVAARKVAEDYLTRLEALASR